MGFSKGRETSLHQENGEGPPILGHPVAFRETVYRRGRRQAATLARAVRAGHARA